MPQQIIALYDLPSKPRNPNDSSVPPFGHSETTVEGEAMPVATSCAGLCGKLREYLAFARRCLGPSEALLRPKKGGTFRQVANLIIARTR